MKHGIQTIVISTTEQADAMLATLDACRESAQANDYATERSQPIKWLSCTCCGESYQGRNWWNQEPGYGLGDCCVKFCGASTTPGAVSDCYGVTGIHFLIPQEEKDNPAVIEDRGEPLYGMDERLRIEYDGYVFWKGVSIDHYSGSLLEDSENSRKEAAELIRRCEIVEGRGDEVTCNSVIWNWKE